MVYIQHCSKLIVKHHKIVTLSQYFLVSHMTFVSLLTLILLSVMVYSLQYLEYLDQLPILLKPKHSLGEYLQQQNVGQLHLFNLQHLILVHHIFSSRILWLFHYNFMHYNEIKFTSQELFNLYLICSLSLDILLILLFLVIILWA